MEQCLVIIYQGEHRLKIFCYSIQTFNICLLFVEKRARHCGDILVNQILYLHMKKSILLVDLNVDTIMFSTERESGNIIRTYINNEHGKQKML